MWHNSDVHIRRPRARGLPSTVVWPGDIEVGAVGVAGEKVPRRGVIGAMIQRKAARAAKRTIRQDCAERGIVRIAYPERRAPGAAVVRTPRIKDVPIVIVMPCVRIRAISVIHPTNVDVSAWIDATPN